MAAQTQLERAVWDSDRLNMFVPNGMDVGRWRKIAEVFPFFLSN